MGAKTGIEWCDHTFNPWRGCTPVGVECVNCYARDNVSVKLHSVGWGDQAVRVIKAESGWIEPLRWNRAAEEAKQRRRVFCGSLMDVFDLREELFEPRRRVVDLIKRTPWLDWLLLTKRPEAAVELWPRLGLDCMTNVWAGTTVGHPDSLWRIGHLLKCPAEKKFLSCEPLLAELDLRDSWDGDLHYCRRCEYVAQSAAESFEWNDDTPDGPDEEWAICPECGWSNVGGFESYVTFDRVPRDDRPYPNIDWLIIGAESGPNRRECKLEWVESLIGQADAAGIPVFVKQLHVDGRVSKNPAEWPEWARRREFPRE
jgi:protein gp37